MKLKFEDFQDEKLSNNQQKMVRGGDDNPPIETPPIPVQIPEVDPGKIGGTGGLA